MKRNEIIPSFPMHTYAVLNGTKVYILSTITYCLCCDRFLDEVLYTLKDVETRAIQRRVPESLLTYLEEATE